MTQRGRSSSSRPASRPGRPPADRPADARPGVDLIALRGQLRDIVDPVVTAAGYDLDELTVVRVGRKLLVRITVDGDGGVNLDVVAQVSRLISTALDEAEQGGAFRIDAYDLEVSSPGVDRPLTLPRHRRRNVGRLVKVKTADRQVTGRIEAVDDTAVTLDVTGQRRVVPFDQLGPGRIQVEFSRLEGLEDEDFGDELSDDDDNWDDEEGEGE